LKKIITKKGDQAQGAGNTPREKKEVQVTHIRDANGNGDDQPRQQTPRQQKTMKVIVLSKDTSSTPLYKL